MPDVPSRLAEARWTDVDRADVVLAVPVGSCEQHGPHLPLATDTLIAEALADALAARVEGVVLAPALTVTASGEHAGFPGTLSIGAAAMEEVVVELVRSADWAGGVVLVNGHGGNADAVGRAVARLHGEGRRVLAWWPRVEGGDLHAGATETSIVLALRPDLVDAGLAAPGPLPSIAALRERGVRALSPSGVLGDPRPATAAQGVSLLAGLADDLVRCVATWRAV